MPTGRIEKLHGLDCYTADPPNGTPPKGVVVIIPDAFGWTLPNNRILADCYAKEGNFRVYLPEFMNGTAIMSTCGNLWRCGADRR
jgi:dienelactone hydrolase